MGSVKNEIKLNNGMTMPLIGLGTWKSELGKTGNAVYHAVKVGGYRMIDTANDYNNEAEIGKAIAMLLKEGVVKREELFIQSKLWNSNHKKEHVKPDLVATLKDLQLDYVDSFIVHWPQACPGTGLAPAVRVNGACAGPASSGVMFPIDTETKKYASDNKTHFAETWEAMEALVDEGLTKSIGLSNFNKAQIQEIITITKKHKPVILQNECHPYLQQKDLVDFCNFHDIVFQAYSPLSSKDRPAAFRKPDDPELLEDKRVIEIGKKYKKSPAQVVLRWHLQAGHSAVPKSVTPSRIEQNIEIFDFELDANEMQIMSSMNCGWRILLWSETAMHPDYPFKDELPFGHVVPKAPLSTTTASKVGDKA
eukprot:CAMPEP_0197535458 /NCGR_PEP_ID=MMETSP1318-20131121/50624_1 /TAXON_ID=552666 /ORGANISM="Partenskyella glossopodia, Strain RCC365" /LENGTH=364 /DNA_ID=CAMNT_0043093039 /DNA_START=30 /DNA_END=1120 /DNA_ORIENTATION=-